MSDSEIRAKNGPPQTELTGEIPLQVRFASLQAQTRRHFLRSFTAGVGSMFLGTLASQFAPPVKAAERGIDGTPRLDFTRDPSRPLSILPPQFTPRAKRIIYLHMAGAPSQLELFDHKPDLNKLDGQECPASFLVGKRFAFISGVPKLLGAQYPFHQAGKNGQWMSDRLPHLEKHIDDLCLIKSMRTDQFNHAPAQLLVQTGNARLGYPSMGSWVIYGLGTENQNLPGFIVLVSGGNQPDGGKQLWGSGFLPSVYQGVQCRSQGEPVLYLQLRMFYVHKGTEKLFENLPIPHCVRLAESISGDSSFAHATAFCHAVERAAGVEAPPRARARTRGPPAAAS